jgi:hypothetical protein
MDMAVPDSLLKALPGSFGASKRGSSRSGCSSNEIFRSLTPRLRPGNAPWSWWRPHGGSWGGKGGGSQTSRGVDRGGVARR